MRKLGGGRNRRRWFARRAAIEALEKRQLLTVVVNGSALEVVLEPDQQDVGFSATEQQTNLLIKAGIIRPNYQGAEGFGIKDIVFGTPGNFASMPNWPYRWKGNPATTNFNLLSPNAGGMGGQNNATPHKLFKQHVVISSGGVILDPSYGKTYPSLKSWQDANIDAILKSDKGIEYAKKVVTTSPQVIRIDF
jgi:hypothetical protein